MSPLSQVIGIVAAFSAMALLPPTHVYAITIDSVPISNPGNAGAALSNGTFGAVPYNYRIGKFEVTNAQYVVFLNRVDPTGANTLELYHSSMSSNGSGGINLNSGAANGEKYETKSGRDNNPVVYVTWYNAIRFANWLHNGQNGGSTEDGAYTLLGGTPTPSNFSSITRNPGAKWWLPSEDEWFKAAYHKNDGVTGNYWIYPTSTDVVPYSDQPPGADAPDSSNTINWYKNDGSTNDYDDGYAVIGSTGISSSINYLSDVGAYPFSTSPYGTFDQGGNVWELIETRINTLPPTPVIRGGSWDFGFNSNPGNFRRFGSGAPFNVIGFRVATVVPEPGSLVLLALAAAPIFVSPRRRCDWSLSWLAISFFIALAPQIAQAITIETVPVGNPGNPPDMRYIDDDHPTGVGSVSYQFRMGMTEITNAQYIEFLNAVAATDPYELYNPEMDNATSGGIVRSGVSGEFTYDVKAPALGGAYMYDHKPVTFVSSGDAMRFANWLHNGQPSGAQDATTTEDGAYSLNGALTDDVLALVERNSDARWWLPNENEWYKAAYHKDDGATGNYWGFPTKTNSEPNSNSPSNDTGNSANFDFDSTNGNIAYPMIDVGAYALSDSEYGTFDQAGNVWEWNETKFSGSVRGYRGGSWVSTYHYLHVMSWFFINASYEGDDLGFRIATIPDLSGDFNHDGAVDAADLAQWQVDFGANGDSDADGDGDSDGADFLVWQRQFGHGPGAIAAAAEVPEPTTVFPSAIAAAALAHMASCRKRKPLRRANELKKFLQDSGVLLAARSSTVVTVRVFLS